MTTKDIQTIHTAIGEMGKNITELVDRMKVVENKIEAQQKKINELWLDRPSRRID